MCGICGIINKSAPVLDRDLRAMAKTLVHRGPDDEGFYLSKNTGLGFRRLSIIDLEKGAQPMCNEDETVWTVFNGEIYNFRELREDLRAKGHFFKTSSDTEVIVHGYEEWSDGFVKKIKGMFGLAVWDEKNKRLVLARDRSGIKPLYYAFSDKGLVFASEIRALAAVKDGLDMGMDTEALNLYLSLNYIPAPLTIYKGIRSLLPAQSLVFEEGGSTLHEYWGIRGKPGKKIGKNDYLDIFERQLKKSVGAHMISDVPVGAFLSGGLDSSAVVKYMADHTSVPFKTFSIDFGEKSYSESPYAEAVARRYGTEHYCETVTPDIRRALPGIIAGFGEPFADSSAIPVFFLSKLAAGHVKVVITGDGGDELLGGYHTYVADNLAGLYRKMPGILRRAARCIALNLPVSHKKMSLDLKMKRFTAGAEYGQPLAHLYWRIIFCEEERKKTLANDLARNFSDSELEGYFLRYWQKAEGLEGVNKFCYFDTAAYLPNDMLVKLDVMTMANSLEARVPFLDSDLVELAFELPPELKVRGFTTKYILRKLLARYLPPVIVKREKAGFSVPMPRWINNELRDMFRDVLLSADKRLINIDHVGSMLDRHYRKKNDYSHQLYSLLVLCMWQRENQ